jgi:hypothetical protein
MLVPSEIYLRALRRATAAVYAVNGGELNGTVVHGQSMDNPEGN